MVDDLIETNPSGSAKTEGNKLGSFLRSIRGMLPGSGVPSSVPILQQPSMVNQERTEKAAVSQIVPTGSNSISSELISAPGSVIFTADEVSDSGERTLSDIQAFTPELLRRVLIEKVAALESGLKLAAMPGQDELLQEAEAFRSWFGEEDYQTHLLEILELFEEHLDKVALSVGEPQNELIFYCRALAFEMRRRWEGEEQKIKDYWAAISRGEARHASVETEPSARTYTYTSEGWREIKDSDNVPENPRPFNFLTFRGELPTGFSSWERSPVRIVVTPKQLHWLRGPALIDLDLLSVNVGQGVNTQIYLGVLISDKVIEHLGRGLYTNGRADPNTTLLTQHTLHDYEKLFFNSLLRHMDVGGRMDKKFYAGSEWENCYEASNGQGKDRVYFAKGGEIDGKTVFIVFAAGPKATQIKLRKVIQDNPQIRKKV